ncbi:hypothetical protein ACO0LG_28125 [Undibacterium sp. Ji42W]|uniref:hypothetical protein n=1 Tax=Undibacterium sp. Ji42W TaxID=3413039 RepID=UPI003BF3AC65
MHHGKVSAEIAAGLLVLKESIKEAAIPSSKLDETINIATWNIREFGKNYTVQQFSFQMSDHVPIWIQVKPISKVSA